MKRRPIVPPAGPAAVARSGKWNRRRFLGALYGRLPSPEIRRRMAQHFEAL